ncbi:MULTISPECIES: hypothetical protein [unclassified Streptomyces]|uniref:hypothetical protein n=1 Tax=unclassified Streptomyces TaxID=2593676 RepID=UPI000DD753AE|nr:MULTISPECIES: hypothetical protein [unclassified Streptomyces]QZZ29777.1 hypothetical protein A7X85_29200 [Streptomyces sp. ST1015]
MNLVELLAGADELTLAASGLACLDRCVSLLGGDDEALRPLWGNLAPGGDPEDWPALLQQVRSKLDGSAESEDDAVLLARAMLDAAPAGRTGPALRDWADTCSLAALRIHLLLDLVKTTDDIPRDGRTEGLPPLVVAELRRQVTVLEVVAAHGGAGLRRAVDVSTEGRRVLRAVVSRRGRVVGAS